MANNVFDYLIKERNHLRSMALALILLSSAIYGYNETKAELLKVDYDEISKSYDSTVEARHSIDAVESLDVNSDFTEKITELKKTNEENAIKLTALKNYLGSMKAIQRAAVSGSMVGIVFQGLAIFFLIYIKIGDKLEKEENILKKLSDIRVLLIMGFLTSAMSLVLPFLALLILSRGL